MDSKLEPKLVESLEKKHRKNSVRTLFLRVAFSGVLLPNVLNRISRGRRERKQEREREREKEKERKRKRENYFPIFAI